jgi:transposase-like protein
MPLAAERAPASGAASGGRVAPDPASPLRPKGRFSAQRKAQAVLRLLAGEDLETLSRSLGVTAFTLSQWRDAFLACGAAALKTRADEEDPRDDLILQLRAKIGELTMSNELLDQKIGRLETGRPLARRRSRP